MQSLSAPFVNRDAALLTPASPEWAQFNTSLPDSHEPPQKPHYEPPQGYPMVRRYSERSPAAYPLPPEVLAEMCARLPRRSSAMRERLLAEHVGAMQSSPPPQVRRHTSATPPTPAKPQKPIASQQTSRTSWWERVRRRWAARRAMRRVASVH